MRAGSEKPSLAAVPLILAASLAGCQCSGGNGASVDDSATDADSDADSDTDTGTGSDTGPDPCPGEETDVALDPALEWEPIPAGMECGPGCQQLTGAGGALSFDVWGDWVIVMEDEGQPSPFMTLVNVSNVTSALLDYGLQTVGFITAHPTVSNGEYLYVLFDSNNADATHYMRGTSEQKSYGLLEPCIGSLYQIDGWGKWLAYVWETFTPGMQDIYLLDRETLERKAVTDFGGVGEITLSGDWITFTRIGGNVEIWAYNVVTEELTNISDHPSDQFNSRNDGPRVVWTDLRADPEAEYYDWSTYGAADIWFYDIETQELRQITSGNGAQIYPDINGDWIVWQDSRECPDPGNLFGDCLRIWGYNLVTEEERRISQIPGSDARVWGDRVYFGARYEEDPPKGAVFVQDLNELPEPDAGPDGGK